MPLAADGHLVLLHRFQQRGLRLRRRAVDLVGQHDVGEDRPVQEAELARARSRLSSWITSVPVMSDGIRSGVNWMRLNVERQRVGQRADHQRLGQARHADQQAVPAGEERDQQLLDHLAAGRRSPCRARR